MISDKETQELIDKFVKATGSEPDQDDLERVSCNRAGDFGHRQCGWCIECDKPRFMCGCGPRFNDIKNG